MNLAQIIADHLAKDKPFVSQPKIERKTRQPKNPIDWEIVDLHVFKAALHFSFSGTGITKFVLTCPTFVKGDDTKNRAIINESLDSLAKRGLVKVTGHGRDRYVQAANGASIVSYFPRNELPPVAIVYRRTTVKEEIEINDLDFENINLDNSAEQ